MFAVIQHRHDLPPGERIERVRIFRDRSSARGQAVYDAEGCGIIDRDATDGERDGFWAMIRRQDFITNGTRTVSVVRVES